MTITAIQTSAATRSSSPGLHAEVLIVGGGLVGMSLAVDLAARGVQVALAEKRAFGQASCMSGIALMLRTEALAYVQARDLVEVSLLDLEAHTQRRLRCRYVVGCDGGNSRIRSLMGAQPERSRHLPAARRQDRNVFLAGAAAQAWAPDNGYDLNATIADALGLSALLVQRLQAHDEDMPVRCRAAFPAAGDPWLLAA